jgi:hypothetical protein
LRHGLLLRVRCRVDGRFPGSMTPTLIWPNEAIRQWQSG